MFLYKSDVGMILTLQPARMSHVLHRSGAAAAKQIADASYGVVMQVDGVISGVLPVCVRAAGPHVLGAYSEHNSSDLAHCAVVREMLEMFLSELDGPAASAQVSSCDVPVFAQCGFVPGSSCAHTTHMDFCMPGNATVPASARAPV